MNVILISKKIFFSKLGKIKVVYEKDTKMQNAGTFIIENEDHTVGNLVRETLLKDPEVKINIIREGSQDGSLF